MKNYKQLSLEQRYQIQSLLNVGLSQTAIALHIGANKSTISPELQRNIPKRKGQTVRCYIGEYAQRKTDYRYSKKPKRILLTELMKKRIAGLMEYEKWSPELIANRLSKDSENCLSHQTIYKWIWMAKHSNRTEHSDYKNLYKLLRHKVRRQKRKNIKDNRGTIKARVGIEALAVHRRGAFSYRRYRS